jgi:hypothetical protein
MPNKISVSSGWRYIQLPDYFKGVNAMKQGKENLTATVLAGNLFRDVNS